MAVFTKLSAKEAWIRDDPPKYFALPHNWIMDFRHNYHPVWWYKPYLLTSGKVINLAVNYFTSDEAESLCQKYLETVDKTQWPLLMGMSPVMDEVLATAFKGNI